MIEKPDDTAQVARIHGLLNAFAEVGKGTMFLHETSLPALSYAVWSWAGERGIKIGTHVQCGCGDATECWDIYVAGGTIHVFPNKMGQLASIDDSAKAEIEKIKREAAERIKALLGDGS